MTAPRLAQPRAPERMAHAPSASARHGIQSMTGFGRATAHAVAGTIHVEIRSTNHRYLEVEPRLPDGFLALQSRLVELLRQHVRRGRVEITVAVQAAQSHRRRVVFDESLLAGYHAALVEFKQRFGLKGPVTLEHLLTVPQAVRISEERVPAERFWEPLERALRAAVQELLRARRREGAQLVADLRRQLRAIEGHVASVKRRLPRALAEHRGRLQAQIKTLLGPATPTSAQARQAIALVEGVDVHEELIRLESHVSFIRSAFTDGRLLGKRLDFMAQELMREVNTLGAKVNDAAAMHHVVDMKGCIEKIREQSQNLE